MANAADYLTFSTQQVLANYKLRTRAIPSQEVTVTNTSNAFRITVLIEDTFDASELSPNQLILGPQESKSFTIRYNLAVMESLPVGTIPATINFTATAEPIIVPPPPPLPPPPPPPPPLPIVVQGCTDASAINYNRAATVDNGSCIPKIFGCTNPYAVNYNPAANVENGICEFPPRVGPQIISGCTNRNALNYNPQATEDDGSCIPAIIGCQDVNALNYNPNANTTGECYYRPPVEGCMDTSAQNYNPIAVISRNDLCTYQEIIVTHGDVPQHADVPVHGDTPAHADTPVHADTPHDDTYRPPHDVVDCMDPLALNYNPRATRSAIPNNCQPVPVSGCTIPGSCNYNPLANLNDGSCIQPNRVGTCGPVFGCTDTNALNYNPNADTDDRSCTYQRECGCMDPSATNFNPRAVISCGECTYSPRGCTNPSAINYNRAAAVDDGSCMFVGCKDPGASNYDPSDNIAPCPNNACCTPRCECANLECQAIGQIISQGAANSSGFANICRSVQAYAGGSNGCPQCPAGCTTSCTTEYVGVAEITGCRDTTATNFNPRATIDGPCDYLMGCTSSTATNYNPRAVINDGSCTEPTVGCTDVAAKNYNPKADTDDGSCKYAVFGCTDFVALNYNSAATDDDGSCKYYTSGGGGRTDPQQDTLIANTVGGGTVEPGGVNTQNQI